MGIRKLLLLCCVLSTATFSHAATADVPTIDFGTIYYCPDGSGAQTVAMPDTGTATTKGSGGGITKQEGGAAGQTQIHKGWFEFLSSSTFYTKKAETRTKNACGGSITLSNTTTENGNETATAGIDIFSGTYFNVGADLTVNSFNSATPCPVTDTVSGILSFKVGSGSTTTALNLTYTATIVPVAKVAHHDGSSLNFGTFCRSSSQQTLTLSPNGTVTSSSVRCPVSADISADEFDVVGVSGFQYNIEMDSSTTLTNGSNTLAVSNLTPSCTQCSLTSTHDTVTVGGTITVPGSSPSGEYIGHYELSITY